MTSRAEYTLQLESISGLSTDPHRGLTQSEIEERKRLYPKDKLESLSKPPLVFQYLQQLKEPCISLLLVSGCVSIYLNQVMDALSIFITVFVVTFVGFYQELRSERTLKSLKNMLPMTAKCLRDGYISVVSVEDLFVGDVIILCGGDAIPADMVIIETSVLLVDESNFTGEVEPKEKSPVSISELSGSSSQIDEDHIAFMGTYVCSGSGKGLVLAIGERTRFGSYLSTVKNEENPRSPLQNSLDLLSKKISIFSLLIVSIVVILGLRMNKDYIDTLNVGISLAVAAIPEGLPLIVAFTLALGVIRISKRHAIVKSLSSLETLGCVDVMCVDKTGTITCREMDPTYLHVTSSLNTSDVLTTYHISAKDLYYESGGSSFSLSMLLSALYATSHESGHLELIQASNHVAKSIYHTCDKINLGNYIKFCVTKVIPFSSSTKFMTVLGSVKSVSGPIKIPEYFLQKSLRFSKGAPEIILSQCTHHIFEERIQLITHEFRDLYFQYVSRVASRGMKVIGFSFQPPSISLENSKPPSCFLGLMSLQEKIRESSIDTISILKERYGVTPKIITGDALENTVAISNAIFNQLISPSCHLPRVISGDEWNGLNDEQKSAVVLYADIFYRTTPNDKLSIVRALQRNNKTVAMIGDGVNDAAALKISNIGISMGVDAAEISRDAADVVLVNNDMYSIVLIIEEAKRIFCNIRNFIKFQLSMSIATIGLMLVCMAKGEDFLFASHILLINVIMDGPPSQSLGVEAIDVECLPQNPRDPSVPILTREIAMNTILTALIIITGVSLIPLFIDDKNDMTRRKTCRFTCLVAFASINAICCRSMNLSVFDSRLKRNTAFILSFAFCSSAQLAIIYIKPMNAIFKTCPLSIHDLAVVCILPISLLIVEEIRKHFKITPLSFCLDAIWSSRQILSQLCNFASQSVHGTRRVYCREETCFKGRGECDGTCSSLV